MINFMAWLILGGTTGLLISLLTHTDVHSGMVRNIVVGIIGAFVGGPMLTPYFGISVITENILSFPALLMSLLGAIGLVVLFSGVLRGGLWLRQRLARVLHA